MSELDLLEEWMADLLRRRTALPSDPEVVDIARSRVSGNGRLSPVEQLEIYREQFWLRHTGSLLEDFPGLSGILGQKDWDELVVGYLQDIRPTSWSLRDLGDRLPAHVERADWLPHHELCIDMVRLEWAYVELFDAVEVPPLDGAKIAQFPEAAWETARIVLAPALSLLRVAYPVGDLRRTLRANDSGPVPIPERSPENLVLYRGADLSLYHTNVSEAAFEVLAGLREGLPLVASCERASERVPGGAAEIEEHAGEWFMDWGRRGWVVDVEVA